MTVPLKLEACMFIRKDPLLRYHTTTLPKVKVCSFTKSEIFHRYFSRIFRSSRPEVFCKKNVLRNFENFTGKHCGRDSFLIKLQAQRLQLY